MEKIDDSTLVTKVVTLDDRKSFDLLVRKYQSAIRGFFLRQTLGDAQLSDDLAQDTFVKAYTHLASFRGKSSFSTWLYRIAYNVWYDYTRAHKQTQDLEAPSVARQNARADHPSLRIDLLHALRILGEHERTCVTLQLMEGLPIDQIAEVTGMAQGTVKSHLSRGKAKLAKYLRENGYAGK